MTLPFESTISSMNLVRCTSCGETANPEEGLVEVGGNSRESMFGIVQCAYDKVSEQ